MSFSRPLSMCLLIIAAFLSADASSQEPSKKPPVEEEEPVKRPTSKPPPLDLDTNAPTDLLLEAVRAPHPDVKDLFRRLAIPHDVITQTKGDKLTIVPVPYFLGPGSTFSGELAATPLDDQWKPTTPLKVARGNIKSAVHYEQIAQAAVEEFLQNKKEVKPLDRLDAAEKVLAAALHFHRGAGDRRVREGERWKEIETKLKGRLLSVRIDRLGETAVSGSWEDAFAWGDRLMRIYGDANVHQRIVGELAKLVDQSLKQERYEIVQKQIRELERFPNSAAAIQPIVTKLRTQAADLLNKAKAAKEQNSPEKANELMNKADRLWPRLEGLRDFRWKLNQDHPTLCVGVRELPAFFSPATAVLDSEKQAVELQFESLVEPFHGDGGEVYEPSLAAELPQMTPFGRTFRIERDATWSNGDRVTADDVRSTLQLLGRANGMGGERADLIEPPIAGRDAASVTLNLRQGFLDPLSVMSFKILPSSANLDRLDDTKFAKRPVGSGPYQLAGAARSEGDQKHVVFVANSAYHRSQKPGMPHIQEIRMFQSADPIADFTHGRLHLLLDLTGKQAEAIKRPESGLSGMVNVHVFKNRRIYFLTVNHRRRLLQNVDVRKAIAHAINRNQILADVFGGELKNGGEPAHRPLNGPFPPGSWACDPTLPADPWKPDLAGNKSETAKQALTKIHLTLKYPEGDESVKDACSRMRDQIQKETGFEIELIARPRRALHKEIEHDHDYDLAYYAYDFPNELYSLWPLLNPETKARGPGGGNFLGYHNDGVLESWLNRALGHREFAKVRESAHKIHAEMWAKMPLIPLWQLDTIIAVHRDLATVRIDPLLVFTDVERWKLGK